VQAKAMLTSYSRRRQRKYTVNLRVNQGEKAKKEKKNKILDVNLGGFVFSSCFYWQTRTIQTPTPNLAKIIF